MQKGLSDLKLTSRLPKSATAIISNTDRTLDIVFQEGLIQFGIETSKYSSVGPVSFVTTHLDTNGESKVIWTNGEWCFTAFVNYEESVVGEAVIFDVAQGILDILYNRSLDLQLLFQIANLRSIQCRKACQCEPSSFLDK